jgi:hypothetical protein
MKELIVETPNPAYLDRTLQQMGGCVGQNPDGSYRADENGHYTVRGANVDFLKFAIANQGYAKVIEGHEIPPLGVSGNQEGGDE